MTKEEFQRGGEILMEIENLLRLHECGSHTWIDSCDAMKVIKLLFPSAYENNNAQAGCKVIYFNADDSLKIQNLIRDRKALLESEFKRL